MGQSGTGKSTLLKAMIGLVPINRGQIRFYGRNIGDLSAKRLEEVRRDMAFVFQSGALFSSLTIFDNCALTLRERDRLPERDVQLRVTEALDRVGLANAASRMPGELSGGMVKRAGIARALALWPRVLLFDEPTTGADPITTTSIMHHIKHITGDSPIASVVVTHDVEAVERYADRAALLLEGAVIWEGNPNGLNQTTNPVVQQFITGSVDGPIPL